MLAHLLAQNPHLYDLGLDLRPGGDDFRFVEELILGGDLEGGTKARRGVVLEEKGYLYDIVNNTDSGLDVDKLDYLLRDPQACNDGKPSFNVDTLLDGLAVRWAKMRDGRRPVIAYAEKVASEVYKVFRSRYDFHSEYYHHKNVPARDMLLTDLLLECDQFGDILEVNGRYSGIGESVRDVRAYEKLNDAVLTRCESWLSQKELDLEERRRARLAGPSEGSAGGEESPQMTDLLDRLEPAVTKGRELLNFWHCHGHYKCLHQRVCTDEELEANDLKARLRKEQDTIREATGEHGIEVMSLVIHFGHPVDKSKNPLGEVCFFAKADGTDVEVHPGPPPLLGRARNTGPFMDKFVRYYARDVALCLNQERLQCARTKIEEMTAAPSATSPSTHHHDGREARRCDDVMDETQMGHVNSQQWL